MTIKKELMDKLLSLRQDTIKEVGSDLVNINIVTCFSNSELDIKDSSGKLTRENQLIASIQLVLSDMLEVKSLCYLFMENIELLKIMGNGQGLCIYIVKPFYNVGEASSNENFTIYNEFNVKFVTLSIEELSRNILDILDIRRGNKVIGKDIGENPIFIFKGVNWGNVVYLFKLNNLIINGGSVSNRHKLSEVEFRLSLFLKMLSLLDNFSVKSLFSSSIRENFITKARYDKDFYLHCKKNLLIDGDLFSHKNKFISALIESNNQLNMIISLIGLDKQIKEIDLELDMLKGHFSFLKNESNKIESNLEFKLQGKKDKTSERSKSASKGQIHNLRKELQIKLNEQNVLEKNILKIEDKKVSLNNNLEKLSNEISMYIENYYLGKEDVKMSRSSLDLGNKYIKRDFNSGKRSFSTSSNILSNRLDFLSSDSVYSVNSPIFKQLNRILLDSSLDKSTQLKIESFLVDHANLIFNEKINKPSDLNYNLISGKIVKIIKNLQPELAMLIDNKRENYKLEKNSQINLSDKNVLFYNLITNSSNEFIISLVLGRLLKIISNKDMVNQNTQFTEVAMDLGSDLIENYFLNIFSNEVSKGNILPDSLNIWFKKNEDEVSQYRNSTNRFYFGVQLITLLMDIGLVESRIIFLSNKEKRNVLIPGKILYDAIGEFKIMTLPNKIPMVVKPKPYSRKIVEDVVKEELGGFLLNDLNYISPIIIQNWELKNPSEIEDDNVIYDLVNNISSVGYKINIEVLDFILNYGIDLNLILNPKESHPLNEKLSTEGKLSIKEGKILEGYLSQKQLELNIIGLALIYKNIPEFYIPIRIDNRGRAYCNTDYLNYQSIELAKSLLLFSNEEKIELVNEQAVNYLKIYGANCFGNGLNKKSFEDRINWVNENENKILDFKNSGVISLAESKLLFTAFCFEYCNYNRALKNGDTFFYSGLPIQLDATCNGYQHLALLTGDESLSSELNLTSSTFYDKPKDFYTFVALHIKDYFIEKISQIKKGEIEVTGEILESYERLANLNIQRALIKQPVMTKPYNASLFQIKNYIQEEFDQDSNHWFIYKKDTNVKLKRLDISILAQAVEVVIYKKFPKLNEFSDYLKKVADICNRLNITIPWYLPTGLKVDQDYIDTDLIRIKPFLYQKSSFSLRVPNKEKRNRGKQVRALMPNLVHSLDAASLALLVNLVFKDDSFKIKNIYSVHDCFAVTANNVQDLINKLKLVYTKIYSDNNYIVNFDKGIKEYIKLQFGQNSFSENERILKINNLEIEYPDIKTIIEGNSVELLKNSTYLIN